VTSGNPFKVCLLEHFALKQPFFIVRLTDID
jgi:hypothetical protein